MFACNCLNVIIETESTNDFLKVNTQTLQLSQHESDDIFFQHSIHQIGKLIRINKQHASLIRQRLVGSWMIYQCLNCNLHTHAIHSEKGAGLVLANSNLIGYERILELKRSCDYSKVFNIVIKGVADVVKRDEYLPADVELTIGRFKQIANDFTSRESLATEERVRLYTEQQYAALEEFRERVHKEQRALASVILYNDQTTKPTSTNLGLTTTYNATAFNVPDEDSNTQIKNSSINSNKLTPAKTLLLQSDNGTPDKRTNNMRLSRGFKNSLDAEGLFQLEDMDETKSYPSSDFDDSDGGEVFAEDKDDVGIQMKHARTVQQSINLAKSLPMNIPVFISPMHMHEQEEHDDLPVTSEDRMDIAASIKALAKSVHGDTVFGDLPRPRCNTNI